MELKQGRVGRAKRIVDTDCCYANVEEIKQSSLEYVWMHQNTPSHTDIRPIILLSIYTYVFMVVPHEPHPRLSLNRNPVATTETQFPCPCLPPPNERTMQ